jgi:hypothetical protein
MMRATSSATPLPQPIADYINRFVARRRTQRLLRAAVRALLFSIVWMLAWCAIDRFVTLDSGARAIALGLNIAIITLILIRPMLAMLRRRADVNIAAAEIERREPRWSQRLRTVTSRIGDEHDYGSSRELLDALASQVADEARDRDAAALLSWRPVVRPAVACAIWLIMTWLLSFSSWLDLPTLARRYLMPTRATPAVTTTRIIVAPGDAEVTQGDPLRVQATAIRLSAGRSPTLHVRARSDSSNAQTWHVEPMTAMPDGQFEAQIARVDRDLEYFVTGGDARTDTYRVTMLLRPAVRQFRIHYSYPPHTGLAPREVTNETGVIEAPVGTEVALAIEATEPLNYAVMTMGAESIRITPATTTQPSVAQTSFTIAGDRVYTLRMVSDRGVSGVFRGGTIRAIADRAPVAQFRDFPSGGTKREVSAGDVVPMAYQAVDDYGLARLDLDIRIIRKSGAQANASISIPLIRGQRDQQGVQPVDLRKFGLEVGDEIELRLKAEDRAGQFALSVPARLLVTSPASRQSAQAPPTPPAATTAPSTSPSSRTERTERTNTPPFDPPGYEAAIRAYFDALRRTAPTTQP